MKTKKISIIILSVVIVTTICISVIYNFFLPKFGMIEYSTEVGLKFKGKNKQYGQEHKMASEVSCELMQGYVFEGWNDGNPNMSRTDIFKKGSETFIALSDYQTHEVPIFSYHSANNSISIIDGESIDVMKCKYFSKDNTFYNLKGLVKPDYRFEVTKRNTLFGDLESDNGLFFLRSINVDKTFSRQLLAFELSKLLFDDFYFNYKFINLYYDDAYFGLYIVFYLSLPNDAKIVISENTAKSESYSFTYNNRFGYIINNKTNLENEDAFKLISDSVSNKKMNYSSLAKGLALVQIFKNNALSEDDYCYYLNNNNEICYSPLSSYSLSAGLWRWGDYHYSGSVNTYSHLSLLNETHINMTKEYIKNIIDRIPNIYNSIKTQISSLNESLALNAMLWPIQSTFGTPDELANYSTIDEHFNYLDNFISNRITWLKEYYLK